MLDRDLCVLVSGRWDNTVSVVDVRAALAPENEATPNAILNTVRVTPDLAPAAGETASRPASGQPVSILVAPTADRVFVVNHSGSARPEAAAAFQHGHPGAIAVLDLALLFDRRTAGTLAAVRTFIETGTAGPVGSALAPDARHLLVTSAEAAGREDGGRQITVIDLESNRVLHQVMLAARGGTEPAPSPHAAPHPTFGHYPCPNGIAVSPFAGGLAFTANGGTGDVSVIRLAAALRNEPGAEVAAPIPVEAGPFGIAASPDGGLVAVASREDARTGTHGRTVSLIDVERAAAGFAEGEVARVPVGIGSDGGPSRPFDVAFTPDGRQVLATCNRSGVVSCVDVAKALTGKPCESFRLALTDPSGGEPCPRGIAVAPGGRLAAVVGGRKGGPRSSLVWLIDLAERRVAATVAGVGNEAYALAFAERP